MRYLTHVCDPEAVLRPARFNSASCMRPIKPTRIGLSDAARELFKAQENIECALSDLERRRYNSCANRCHDAWFQAAIAVPLRAVVDVEDRGDVVKVFLDWIPTESIVHSNISVIRTVDPERGPLDGAGS